jgi:hypothetical protein
MKKIFLTLILCGFVGAMFAQGVKFGVTAGLNASSINLSDDEGVDIGYKAGFQAGVVVDLGITPNFSIIPELNFSQKGAKMTIAEAGTKADWNMTLNYLTLPINLAYKFDLGLDQKLMVFAGPYLGYGLSTSNKVKAGGIEVNLDEVGGDDFNIKFGSKDENLKPFDFGLNAGVGYQYSNIFFKVQYNLGLANLIRTDGGDDYMKNSNVAVTVGYMF